MNHDLKLRVSHVEGALVRILGVTERRGWATTSLSAAPDADEDTLGLDLTVLGDRPVDLLVRQLAKLHDVQDVKVAS